MGCYKRNHTKVVGDFDTFPAIINAPLLDKRFMCNDLWKWRGAAGNSCFLDKLTWTDLFSIQVFIPVKTEETQNIKIVGDFTTFPKSSKAPDFDTGLWSSRRWKLGRFLDRNLT
jgi:hypothetical protein